MEKLFAALEAKHPGCRVVDVKFTVNPAKADNQDIDALDSALAKSVREAKEIKFEDLHKHFPAPVSGLGTAIL
ncbi:MAG: hypothetical protein ABJN42_19880 [Roseibium sp.]|uniref:hypothetical protein n=1 Tax=Roseibium sp. TaxID=1936156 RepID=UPI003298C079